MPGRRREGAVAGLEPEDHQEGLGPVGLDEVGGVLGGHVVDEALARGLDAVDLDRAVEVHALADEARGGVEPRTLAGLVAMVPLAEVARDIPGRAEQGGDREVARGVRRVVVGHAVDMPVLARDERGPRRRAEGVHHEGVPETHALGGETVEVWRAQPGETPAFALLALHHPEGVPALVVREDVDEVGRARGVGGPGPRAGRDERQREEEQGRETHRRNGLSGRRPRSSRAGSGRG